MKDFLARASETARAWAVAFADWCFDHPRAIKIAALVLLGMALGKCVL